MTIKKQVITILALLCCTASFTASALKPMNEFIDELMSRMTLQEKIGQLNLQVAGDITTGAAQDTQVSGLVARGELGGVFNLKGTEKIRGLQKIAVEQSRLGIPLIVGMDVIHGYETIFPIPLAAACSWDTTAIREMARISALEATADGIDWVFSPMLDIALDPRWGRIAEGEGEDPFLTSVIGAAYIKGYQGAGANTPTGFYDPRSAMTCIKHYALYGACEAGRDYNTVDMSHVRMYNQYFPPFKAAVDAGADSFMSAFNTIDGEHATASHWLLTEVLRNQWKFKGFVATDYGAIGEMPNHGYGDIKHCSAIALKAGTDMDMCSRGFMTTLESSINDGTVTEEQINIACRRILEAKYKLGLFDDPYRYLDPTRRARDIYTDANRKASRDMAPETFVLLKNDNVLPLRKQGKIALIGPLANDRANIAGTWCVAYTPERYSTIKEAMERALKGKAELLYAQGSNLTRDAQMQRDAEFGKTIARGDEATLKAEALEVARQADVIVCAMGECADFSGESSSRAYLEMPDVQRELLEELVKLDKPIVLLNFSGRPTILTWENEHVDAIMNVWFAGSEAGDAIADVLFGDKAPSGKLTTTFPQAMGQIPMYYNHMNTGRPVPEHADKYYKYRSNYFEVRNDPLFPFGFGLNYTTFSYSPVTTTGIAARTADGSQAITHVSCTVTNTGSRDGDEIVQFYIRDLEASIARPVKELKGFKRIHLKAGETQQVTFDVTPDMLSFYNGQGQLVFEPGKFELMIGPNSDEVKRTTVTVN